MALGSFGGGKWLSNILLGLAVVLLVVVVKFHSSPVMKTSAAEHWDQRRYEKLKFTDSRTVVGLRQNGTTVSMDEWKVPRSDLKTKSWQVDAGVQLGSVKISPDVEYVAWPSGDSVAIRNLNHIGKELTLPAQHGARPLDMGFLQGGSLVVLYSDGTMARWRVSDQTLLHTATIPLKNPDRMAADEDYIAAASSTEGKLMLYRASDSTALRVVEQAICPPPPFEMVIPGHGQVALLTAGGIFLNGSTINTPGRVRSLAFGYHGDLLAAGDFAGIYSVPKGEKAVKIAEAAANSVIAANDGYLVNSGAGGTSLFEFGSTLKIDPSGYTLLWGLGGLVVAAILALLDHLVFGFGQKSRTVKVREVECTAPRELPEPPAELVEAAQSGQLVLWAGSGLSAHAGQPSRESFIRLVIESGRFEQWLPSRDADKLAAMFDKGEHEQVLDTLVEERPELRTAILKIIKGAYPRQSLVPKAHLALRAIPFHAAITTNYDLLLEQLEGPWPHNVIHLKNNAERDQLHLDRFFLLKLYGDLLRPHTLLLSRSEMLHWFQEPGGMAPVVHNILETRPVLFLGCSFEGLMYDLNKLRRPRAPHGPAYAIVATRDEHWRKKAAELESRHHIHVMPCIEDAMSSALPRFLETLAHAAAQSWVEVRRS